MNWKKVWIPLSLAFAAGLIAAAPAAAQDAEQPAPRRGGPHATRRVAPVDKTSPQEVAPVQEASRPRRARPAQGAPRREKYPGMETRRIRRGARPGGPVRPESTSPRIRVLMERIRRALLRNPELVPRLERWLAGHEGGTGARGMKQPGMERGKPARRGKAVSEPKVRRLPPGAPPPAKTPPPGHPKKRKEMQRSRKGPAEDTPVKPGYQGQGRQGHKGHHQGHQGRGGVDRSAL